MTDKNIKQLSRYRQSHKSARTPFPWVTPDKKMNGPEKSPSSYYVTALPTGRTPVQGYFRPFGMHRR
jgi:hypothetical protein